MEIQPGTQIGPYEVLARIGSGGMAQLFLGRKGGVGGFSKQICIKIVHPRHVEDHEFVKMFLDEARISAHFDHPNLIHVFDVDMIDQAPYLAMEYIEGPSLNRLFRRAFRNQDVEPAGLALIVAHACRGLHAAHNTLGPDGRPLGVIHRDVSPHNILVSVAGQTKLIDFGIAAGADRMTRTEVGVLKGKLQYMAPEQLGDGGYDHRVDVFAMGAVLFHITTGQPAYAGENTQDLWRQRLKDTVPDPAAVSADYPEALREIVLRAMATRPEDRYPTAQAMAEDLEAWATANGWGQQQVAAWIARLFPGETWIEIKRTGQTDSRVMRAPATTAHTTGAPAPEGSGATLGQATGTLTLNQAGVALGAGAVMLAFAALIAVGVVVWALNRPAPEPQPVAVAEVPKADGRAPALLDEAERKLDAGATAEAVALLDAAAAVGDTDAQVAVRTSLLRVRITRTRDLAAARRALRLGAVDQAEQLLAALQADGGEHPEVAALESEVLAAKSATVAAPPEPEPEPDGKSAAKATPKATSAARAPKAPAPARLHLDASPVADVFIDGENYGATPLRDVLLAPGAHRVELRRAGYETAARDLDLAAGETLPLSFSLAARPVAPTAVVIARVEPSPEPVLAMTAPIAAASPVVAPPAPAARPLIAPTLPVSVKAANASEISRALGQVEQALLAAGYKEAVGVTSPLGSSLAEAWSPGQATELYPRATFAFVAEAISGGMPTKDVGRELRKAHQTGRLRN